MPIIYDNIEQYLGNGLKSFIEHSNRADFCVGYFNLRGWSSLMDEVEKLDGDYVVEEDESVFRYCRVLIGMQKMPQDLVKIFYGRKDEQLVDNNLAKRLKEQLAEEFKNQLTFGAPTNSAEITLRKLSEQLKSGKVVVKLFLRHQLHAKLYLTYGDYLFKLFEFKQNAIDLLQQDHFPKLSGQIHQEIYNKLKPKSTSQIGVHFEKNVTGNFIFYQEATQYWVKGIVGLPHYEKNGTKSAPAHGRYIYCKSEGVAHSICALINSNLFYQYFVAYGDCFHLSQKLVSLFPIPLSIFNEKQFLITDLEEKSEIKTIQTKTGDEITYAEYNAKLSKPIIDQIDTVLARHYGFTEEELDYIINYDIKYRMGGAEEED